MATLDNRIPPPALVLIAGALMATARLGSAAPALPDGWRFGLAVAFFVAAGVFGAPAFAAFGRAKTTINPVRIHEGSSLVTTGIYRFTRNPMYVALTSLLCAWAVLLNQPLAFAGPVLFALFINRFQIVPEERVLTQKFGAAYEAYRRSVRRWL